MRAALSGLKGVRRAEVDLESGRAIVELASDDAPGPEALVKAVEGRVVLPGARWLLASLPWGHRLAHRGRKEGWR